MQRKVAAMFSYDISAIESYYLNCKSLEAQLEESWQKSLAQNDTIEKLRADMDAVKVRNKELMDIVRKLIYLCWEPVNHE